MIDPGRRQRRQRRRRRRSDRGARATGSPTRVLRPAGSPTRWSAPTGADYANTVGQAWAVRRCARPASADGRRRAPPTCSTSSAPTAGFRLELGPADAAAGRCAEGEKSSLPDTDATALAVLALTAETGERAGASAGRRRTRWRPPPRGWPRPQEADGGFGGATSTEGPNTNSTGLAVRALVRAERCEEAGKPAARWIEQLQRGNGAIAYDPATADGPHRRGAAATRGCAPPAQAAPALLYLNGC